MHTVGGAIIAVGVALGVVALVWWLVAAARTAPANDAGLADVAVARGRLIIVPRGSWKLLALTRSLEVPLSQVAGCDEDPDPRSSHPVTLRVGGTGLPGRVRAGYMVGTEGRSWALYRYGPNAVVIELQGNGLAYLVVEVDDPTAVAEAIRDAAAAARR